MKLFSTRIVWLILLPLLTQAGKPPVTKWTVKNAFEQKVFIENKGQYEIKDKVASSEILFGARLDGLHYYFTDHSIWIERDVAVKRTPEEIEQLKEQMGENGEGEKDDKELAYKTVPQFYEIDFTTANQQCEVSGSEQVSQYYTFGGNAATSIVAHAYKMITYQNLYPGVDMQFYFPEDKQGFKYSFIVHPGANASEIKMWYPLSNNQQISNEGVVTTHSLFGDFVDHAATATLPETQENVTCKMTSFDDGIHKGIPGILFLVGNYDKTKTLIIDPWTTTPTFTGTNSAYDVDFDNAGNCYVYGGGYNYQLIKFDTSGKQIWSYTTNFTYQYYGDFAVDHLTQSVYILEGFDGTNGPQIVKLNSGGSVVTTFTGSSKLDEQWRISFDHCSHDAVIAGGGTEATNQACYLDTSLLTVSPINVLKISNEYHDMWGCALDNSGYCYMVAARSSLQDGLYDNSMLKLPLNSLLPPAWNVSTGHHFREVNSVTYNSNGGSYSANGYNGIAVGDTDVYTYDSYNLKQWGTTAGTKLNSVILANISPDSLIRWGGLTANDCGDIFLGFVDSIKQYNISLKLVNTIAATDTIYDMMLSGSTLYVCGNGFISAVSVSVSDCLGSFIANEKKANENCKSLGSVIVNPSGGTSPYSIKWNTIPAQKGDTAINLTAGTYIATITDASCPALVIYDTVVIINSGIFPPVPKFTPSGDTLTSSASSGNQWYVNDTAISGATGQTYIITKSGWYEVTVTDTDGCSSTSDSIYITFTGINQISLSEQIFIFPNPATNQLTVVSGQFAVREIKIDNVLGEVIARFDTSPENSRSGTTTMDVSKLSSGIYFIEIETNSGIVIRKFVKE